MKGKDDLCRVAKVKVGESDFIRSLAHLYPLEGHLTEESCEEHRVTPRQDTTARKVNEDRPTERDMIEVDLQQSFHKDSSEIVTSQPEHSSDGMLVDELADMVVELNIPSPTDDAQSQSERNEVIEEQHDEGGEDMPLDTGTRLRRQAAIRARERIAEWTRQLYIHLQ